MYMSRSKRFHSLVSRAGDIVLGLGPEEVEDDLDLRARLSLEDVDARRVGGVVGGVAGRVELPPSSTRAQEGEVALVRGSRGAGDLVVCENKETTH